MKRFAVILLTLILLVQAFPLNAFAAVGHVLTEEEPAAAGRRFPCRWIPLGSSGRK
ncbi:MAG: hypothetical protein IJH38_04965 [Clostridia bacterium]|nr:hypothetical protein [Clostridia bacterium]